MKAHIHGHGTGSTSEAPLALTVNGKALDVNYYTLKIGHKLLIRKIIIASKVPSWVYLRVGKDSATMGNNPVYYPFRLPSDGTMILEFDKPLEIIANEGDADGKLYLWLTYLQDTAGEIRVGIEAEVEWLTKGPS